MQSRTRNLFAAAGAFVIVIALCGSVLLLPNDTESEPQAAPTTTRPPTCAESQTPPLPDGVSCARVAKDYNLAIAALWDQNVRFKAYTEAAWNDYQAELEAARRPSYGGTSYGGSCGGGNWVIPEYIVQRESGCSYDAYNATGCDGQGCIGAYQLHAQHFNGGICSDLGTDPAGQDECAARLWNGGAGAGNWSATL